MQSEMPCKKLRSLVVPLYEWVYRSFPTLTYHRGQRLARAIWLV